MLKETSTSVYNNGQLVYKLNEQVHKLSNLEWDMLQTLVDNDFRYITRDPDGLKAHKDKPELTVFYWYSESEVYPLDDKFYSALITEHDKEPFDIRWVKDKSITLDELKHVGGMLDDAISFETSDSIFYAVEQGYAEEEMLLEEGILVLGELTTVNDELNDLGFDLRRVEVYYEVHRSNEVLWKTPNSFTFYKKDGLALFGGYTYKFDKELAETLADAFNAEVVRIVEPIEETEEA